MPSSDTQFKKGHAGRKKGSKNKLSQAFIQDLYKKWQQDGKEALDLLYDTDIATFCRIVAQLVPKDIDIHAEIAGDKDRPLVINFSRPEPIDRDVIEGAVIDHTVHDHVVDKSIELASITPLDATH